MSPRRAGNIQRAIRRLAAIGLAAAFLGGAAPPAPSAWFGTWKLRLSNPTEKPETLVYSDAGGGAMRMVSVEANSVIVTRWDGRPSPNIGTSDGNKRTLAIHPTSPTSYMWTFAMDGKPVVQGRNTLAEDRRRFTEIAWQVERPDKVFTLIYERQ